MKKKQENPSLEVGPKKPYVAPVIKLQLIALEQGIAAGSATVKPVEHTSIQVEDWNKIDASNTDGFNEI
ncbi:hypothetical protein [Elizabethkingia anophelis]|uniref:hypothetical protein n=1 Tax=Elizabethkingia anophelis TaxID=1117645 RepID=UPI001F4ADE9B|nr:hypothetical protein [Elizabethkingia anophelis]